MGTRNTLALVAMIGYFGAMVGLSLREDRLEQSRLARLCMRDSTNIVRGTVISESYSTNQPSEYTIRAKDIDGKIFVLSAIDDSNIPKESLDRIVSVGDDVSFSVGNVYRDPATSNFWTDRAQSDWFGSFYTKRASVIYVYPQAK
jgi:hypothetical protein